MTASTLALVSPQPSQPGIAGLLDLHRRQLLHPFTNHRELATQEAQVFVRGEGIYLIDTRGHRYIDGMSGLWCATLGYSQPEIVSAAATQMERLPYCSSFFGKTHPAAIELAGAIALTPTDSITCSSAIPARKPTTPQRCWSPNKGLRGEVLQRRVVIRLPQCLPRQHLHGREPRRLDCMHAQGGLPLPDVIQLSNHTDMPRHRG
ncbi:MAG: aminotransferase class III-fold pyridoxal phosphate-dependent enzyme [Steroidobacteraceae bacterium]